MEQLAQIDPEVFKLIKNEEHRQQTVLRMIPSENYASAAVMEATASCFTNKYSEGYPYHRYYQGQEYVDALEQMTIDRAKTLFRAEHANVQPYSGSPANQAIYLALLKPGDRVLGMDLAAGGHLTHGAKVSFSGKLYSVRQYGVHPETHLLDYDAIRKAARDFMPRMIIAGTSAYPRQINFKYFREIADEVGAYLMADISHFSGLCLSGDHPHPLPYADVVTTTTHKLLRGPRGGMILCAKELAPAIDKAVFPGLQGGPHENVIAAVAVALKEAATQAYMDYCHQVVKNARTLAEVLLDNGCRLISGGTDNHLILWDVAALGHTGLKMVKALEQAGIVGNANKLPFDSRPADDPSGVRLGTPALTSRGFQENEMRQVAELIVQVSKSPDSAANLAAARAKVKDLCSNFPAPGLPRE